MQIKYWLLGIILITAAAFIYSPGSPKTCVPKERVIALTLDDLPVEAVYFEKIVHALNNHHAPAAGFVIANRVTEGYLKDLQGFLDAGFTIGNHSYSHPNLRKTTAAEYIDDINHADEILRPLMPKTKYYRYPYLAQGSLWKKQKVLNYLVQNHYIVAPITVDSRDFEFNLELIEQILATNNPETLHKLRQRYLNYVWEQTNKAEQRQNCNATKQILLLHANILNSYFLNDLLQMYEEHGYRFITLDEALTPVKHSG